MHKPCLVGIDMRAHTLEVALAGPELGPRGPPLTTPRRSSSADSMDHQTRPIRQGGPGSHRGLQLGGGLDPGQPSPDPGGGRQS